jgi:hypothetical protein
VFLSGLSCRLNTALGEDQFILQIHRDILDSFRLLLILLILLLLLLELKLVFLVILLDISLGTATTIGIGHQPLK